MPNLHTMPSVGRTETGLLVAGAIGFPLLNHQAWRLNQPAFMSQVKVEACAHTLPEEGIKKVGALSLECEDLAGAFPRLVVRDGKREVYEPDDSPMYVGSTFMPVVGYDGVTSVSFGLINKDKFKKRTSAAANTYKRNHHFIFDIVEGLAAEGTVYAIYRMAADGLRKRAQENKKAGMAGV